MIELMLQLGDNAIIDYLLIALMILFVFIFTFTSKSQKSKRMMVKKPIIKTELICIECGFKEIRDFKEGDYIAKETEETCKRCGGKMKINLIYSLEEKKEKKRIL